jgi:hypothetical protein
MKAVPLKLENGSFAPCEPAEATHIKLCLPGPTKIIYLPVQIKGSREGTGNWTWNGDVERPTLRPSVLRRSGHYLSENRKPDDPCWCSFNKEHKDELDDFVCFRCHTWINDGQAQFLDDCSHEHVGKTLDLLEVE